jgi:cold shock protein
MPVGTVKWFCRERGFGYIAPEDKGLDIYVGPEILKNSRIDVLEAGQSIKYEMTSKDGGRPAATCIKTHLNSAELSRARAIGRSLLAFLTEDLQSSLISVAGPRGEFES